MYLSIVISTYNRAALVRRAIESALDWLEGTADVEIIVVDDCSTDDTLDVLKAEYGQAKYEDKVRITTTSINLGATGAKNVGAQLSNAKWLIILDSDDMLITSSKTDVIDALRRSELNSVVFFRCLDLRTGDLIGRPQAEPITVDTKTYLTKWDWAECLPVLNRSHFSFYPYDTDLRGHEGLAYARLFKFCAPGVVWPVIARTYDDTGADRLSLVSARLRRSSLLARGNWRVAREFGRELGLKNLLRTLGHALVYKALSFTQAERNRRPEAASPRA